MSPVHWSASSVVRVGARFKQRRSWRSHHIGSWKLVLPSRSVSPRHMPSFRNSNTLNEFHRGGVIALGILSTSPLSPPLCLICLLFGLLLFFSLYLCCLVVSVPFSGTHCTSVVDVVDFVHFHQLNLVIAKKISSSGGQAHVCECDAAQWNVYC